MDNNSQGNLYSSDTMTSRLRKLNQIWDSVKGDQFFISWAKVYTILPIKELNLKQKMEQEKG
jgi:hypothetical protein